MKCYKLDIGFIYLINMVDINTVTLTGNRLIKTESSVANKTVTGLTQQAQKFVTSKDDYQKNTVSFGVVPVENQISFENNEPDVNDKIRKYAEPEKVYKAIDATNRVISVTENLVKLTEQDERYNTFLTSSTGALSASKGVVGLINIDSSKNKAKTVMNSISQVASGIGSLLGAIDIPQAEFLNLTGKIAGLGVEQQNLTENIKKNDARGIAGTSVSIARGTWGIVISGVAVAKIAASFGHKMGKVSVETVGKITTTSTKITKIADKIAVPFAIAGTGLTFWDWRNLEKKVDDKNIELQKLEEERNTNTSSDSKVKVLMRKPVSEQEIKTQKDIETLKTNSNIMGVSFGLSAISTAALIVSVAFPVTAPITGPISLGGSLAASVAGTLSSDKTRESALQTYNIIKDKYNLFLDKVDNLIFRNNNPVRQN